MSKIIAEQPVDFAHNNILFCDAICAHHLFVLAHADMKKHHRPSKLKMLVILDMRHAASRDVVAGIFRFAAISHRWEVQVAGSHPSNNPLEKFTNWRPDACIIDSTCQLISRSDFLSIAGKVTVFVNTPTPKDWRRHHATIKTNDRAFAEAAAQHLKKKGLTNFGFIGSPLNERWSVARMRFFRAALKDMGFSVSVFNEIPPSDWLAHQEALIAWLEKLPKPCGIWAAFDQRAKHIIDACNSAEIVIPDQIQVLGTDNETYICEQTLPSLSSIMPDFESGGFAAAQYIDSHLNRKTSGEKTKKTLHFNLKGVVERLSSADVNGTARHVELARDFIRKHATSGIDVPSVAAAIGTSTRLLQRNYRAVTGHTVLEDIQSMKLERVKAMLRETTTPIDTIGPMCDFRSMAHLKTLFKARFGMTMSQYRSSCE
jgi:LacI family transcriptional regulator